MFISHEPQVFSGHTSQSSHTAEIFHLAFPHLSEVFLLFVKRDFSNLQHMRLSQFANVDTQFKIGLRSLVEPVKANIHSFAATQEFGLAHLVFAPLEGIYTILLGNSVGHPSLQPARCTYKVPYDIPRVSVEWILQMNSCHGFSLLFANIIQPIVKSKYYTTLLPPHALNQATPLRGYTVH